MSASDKSDGSFGWNDTGEDTMSSSEEGNVSTASSILDRKAHKNKLRKELQVVPNDIKQNGLEDSDGHDVEISAKKRKKKKVKREPNSTFDNTVADELPHEKSELDYRPKKNKIKIEPDQSTIVSSKKSKNKTRSNQQGNEEAEIMDVKEEENESFVKKKKKTKRKLYSTDQQSTDETNDQDNDATAAKKRRKKNAIDENDTISTLLNGNSEEVDAPIEKLTKRKKRISFSTNSPETKLIVERNDSISSDVSCKTSTSSLASGHNDLEPSTAINKPITSSIDVNKQIHSRNSFPLINKRSSFSERIHFEEELPTEDDSDKESTLQKYVTPCKKIDKFMDRNPNLRKLKLKHVNVPINKDDEVWILKCPKDLNHVSLTDLKISLEDRTKLKVDGQTYEGYMQKESSRIAVLLASSTSACEIKDIHPEGILMLRKRIPKVPIDENSIAITNEAFIPLPETKPRHPLFGPDYRKMIKIPAAVAKRLADNSPKKLLSKRKHKVTSIRDEALEEPEDAAIVDGLVKKKKKKRKLSETANDDVHIKKERKKFKHDPEVWNSEKAIEQNLFDF